MTKRTQRGSESTTNQCNEQGRPTSSTNESRNTDDQRQHRNDEGVPLVLCHLWLLHVYISFNTQIPQEEPGISFRLHSLHQLQPEQQQSQEKPELTSSAKETALGTYFLHWETLTSAVVISPGTVIQLKLQPFFFRILSIQEKSGREH